MSKRRKGKADDGRKAGAGLGLGNRWKSIDFHKADAEVSRLQARIAKAVEQGKPNVDLQAPNRLSLGDLGGLIPLSGRAREIRSSNQSVTTDGVPPLTFAFAFLRLMGWSIRGMVVG